MGCAIHTVRAVHDHPVDLLHTLNKAFLKVIKLLYILIVIVIHDLCGFRNSCNTGHILSTGTHAALLAAAKYDGFKLHMAVNIKEANSFRSVDLVSADREHINIHPFRINSGLAKPLHGIHMEQNVLVIRFSSS